MMNGSMIDCPLWENDDYSNQTNYHESVHETHMLVLNDIKHIISPKIVQFWHFTLFNKFVPLDYYAGHFRKNNNERICLEMNVHVCGIPSTPFQNVLQEIYLLFDELKINLENLEINWKIIAPKERTWRLAILLSYCVGKFIKIHPFINGNGRASRFLWLWFLLRFGVPKQVRVSSRPNPPYQDLMREAMNGNYSALTIYVFEYLKNNQPDQI
jgi:fido (protein-threonine AMPylation protein)